MFVLEAQCKAAIVTFNNFKSIIIIIIIIIIKYKIILIFKFWQLNSFFIVFFVYWTSNRKKFSWIVFEKKASK